MQGMLTKGVLFARQRLIEECFILPRVSASAEPVYLKHPTVCDGSPCPLVGT